MFILVLNLARQVTCHKLLLVILFTQQIFLHSIFCEGSLSFYR